MLFEVLTLMLYNDIFTRERERERESERESECSIRDSFTHCHCIRRWILTFRTIPPILSPSLIFFNWSSQIIHHISFKLSFSLPRAHWPPGSLSFFWHFCSHSFAAPYLFTPFYLLILMLFAALKLLCSSLLNLFPHLTILKVRPHVSKQF